MNSIMDISWYVQIYHQHYAMEISLEISLKFAAAIPETVNVIVYLEFSNTISINSAHKSVKDFV